MIPLPTTWSDSWKTRRGQSIVKQRERNREVGLNAQVRIAKVIFISPYLLEKEQ